MNRYSSRIALVLILALPLLVTHCGDDDDNGPAGPSGQNVTSPPMIANLELPQTIDFQSSDPAATQAWAVALVTLIPLAEALGNPILISLQQVEWGDPVGSCWSWTAMLEGGCTFTYVPCKTREGFDWTVTVHGNCFSGGYNQWVAADGTSSFDGTTGEFSWYMDHTTDLVGTWTWIAEPEWISGTLNVYDGVMSAQNHTGILEWTRVIGSTVGAAYTTIGTGKVEIDVSILGTTGSVKGYGYDPGTGAYVLEKWVSWEPGTGFYNRYDDGVLVEEKTW